MELDGDIVRKQMENLINIREMWSGLQKSMANVFYAIKMLSL